MNWISYGERKSINIIGLRTVAKTIPLHSEKMISPVGWRTTFMPFTERRALDFAGDDSKPGGTNTKAEIEVIEYVEDVRWAW